MTELPNGWEWSTLGEVASVVRGVTYKKHEAQTEPGPGLVPLLRATNIDVHLDFDGLYYVPERRVASDQYLWRGDIVVAASSGSVSVVGKSARLVADWAGTFGGFCSAIRSSSQFSSAFLGFYVQADAVRGRWSDLARGSNINNLKVSHFVDTPLPVPPAEEQERIVAAIEEAFSKLDAGEAGLRTVRQLLKRMRDAILAAAVTGRLVPQYPTDTPATKLLADLGVESAPEPPEGFPATWTTVRLGDVVSEPLANGRSVRSRPGGFPVLRLTCLKGGRIDLAERKEGEWEASDAASVLVRRGDFFVSRGNGSLDLVGRGGLVVDEPDSVAYPDTLIRVRVPEDVLDPALLSLVWNARVVRDQLEARARTTAGIYKVNQSMLSDVRLPLPPLEEQARIVVEVDRQMSFLDACERTLEAGLERSAALRRSVLKAAFEGLLVRQDPTDEPASVLLDRIGAERAAMPKKTKARRARAKS